MTGGGKGEGEKNACATWGQVRADGEAGEASGKAGGGEFLGVALLSDVAVGDTLSVPSRSRGGLGLIACMWLSGFLSGAGGACGGADGVSGVVSLVNG